MFTRTEFVITANVRNLMQFISLTRSTNNKYVYKNVSVKDKKHHCL